MPELPEVETVKKQLEQELVGEVIKSVEVRDEMCFEDDTCDLEDISRESSAYLKGEKLVGFERVGKWLFFKFESGKGLEVHLRMTGRLVLEKDKVKVKKTKVAEIEYESAKHTRVVIGFESGVALYYWDVRRFGYLKVIGVVDAAIFQLKSRLGPDPWKMTKNEFLSKLRKTDRKIKDVVLDQSIISGVGNIYANDGLWLSGVDPRRKASSINKDEGEKILSALRKVMSRGLKEGGASDNSYRDLYGEKGDYQKHFLVYGKDECFECGMRLRKEKIGGRGTWWCESCQR